MLAQRSMLRALGSAALRPHQLSTQLQPSWPAAQDASATCSALSSSAFLGARGLSWKIKGRSGAAKKLKPQGPEANPKHIPRAKKPQTPQFPEPTPCPDRVLAAAVLERMPVIMPEMEPWEVAMEELQNRKLNLVGTDVSKTWFQSDMDGMEGAQAEEEDMVFNPRVTAADETNDRKSMERALSESLYLLVKRKEVGEGESEWSFPLVERQGGEDMRSAVTRSVSEFTGDPRIYPVGFPPMSYLDAGSSRVFFYKVNFIKGPWRLNTDLASDYVWVTKAEFKEYLEPKWQEAVQHVCD